LREKSRSAPKYLQNLSLLIWCSPNCRLPSAASQWRVIGVTAFASDRQPANPAGCKIRVLTFIFEARCLSDLTFT
jgi:hypothetical protein